MFLGAHINFSNKSTGICSEWTISEEDLNRMTPVLLTLTYRGVDKFVRVGGWLGCCYVHANIWIFFPQNTLYSNIIRNIIR